MMACITQEWRDWGGGSRISDVLHTVHCHTSGRSGRGEILVRFAGWQISASREVRRASLARPRSTVGHEPFLLTMHVSSMVSHHVSSVMSHHVSASLMTRDFIMRALLCARSREQEALKL